LFKARVWPRFATKSARSCHEIRALRFRSATISARCHDFGALHPPALSSLNPSVGKFAAQRVSSASGKFIGFIIGCGCPWRAPNPMVNPIFFLGRFDKVNIRVVCGASDMGDSLCFSFGSPMHD
jgi:hypothetical protein